MKRTCLSYFLNELLYLWATEGFIPYDLSLKITERGLQGNMVGGIFDPERDSVKEEVKAVTYHKLLYGGIRCRWTASL
jgi:SHS2 domain-containing protein